jgi:hypothetical protein
MTTPIDALRDDYRETAKAWGAMMGGDPKRANALFDHLHGIYKELRASPEGRAAISALMTSDDVGVRISAASCSLGWDPKHAVPILEQIERDGPGLYRTSAKYTLKAFREGTLNLDW